MDPEEHTEADLVGAAAEAYDVDLEQAVVEVDQHRDSSRIWILEEVDDGFRLIGFGMDEEDRCATEEPLYIPNAAIGSLQNLLNVAGLRRNEQRIPTEDLAGSRELPLREIGKDMGLINPLLDGDA